MENILHKDNGMFTSYQLVFRISLAHPCRSFIHHGNPLDFRYQMDITMEIPIGFLQEFGELMPPEVLSDPKRVLVTKQPCKRG